MTIRIRFSRAISQVLALSAVLVLILAAAGAQAEEKPNGKKPDSPQAEQDQPKTDEAKPDEPKADEPKPDEPKPDEPKADEPKADEPDRQPRRRPGGRPRRPRYDKENERRDTSVLSAFRDVVRQAAKGTTAVLSGGKQIAFGAVVDPEGLVLTKASELGESSISCKLNDGRVVDAHLVGVDPDTDLAMLKIEADNLYPVAWREGDAPEVGSWLATTSTGSLPAAVGVVSVEPRKIAKTSGMLGIVPDEGDDGPIVNQVYAGSGAEKAGLRVNDVITHLDGRPIPTRRALFTGLARLKAGDTVKLKVKRGSKELELEATLTSRDNEQDGLGSELSERRGGFASAIQHDTVLNADQCGGPVVDLDGKVVGINIARAGRVVSYALPAASILEVIKSGKLTSAATPDPRMAELDKQLDDLRLNEQNLKNKIEQLRAALAKTLAGLEQARKDAATAQQDLKRAESEAASAQQAVESVERELAAAKAKIDQLTSEKTSLTSNGKQ